MNLKAEQKNLVVNIIIDGKILRENLKYTGNDEVWLQKNIVSQGFNNINDIFLATCDSKNNVSIYSKKGFTDSNDIFQ